MQCLPVHCLPVERTAPTGGQCRSQPAHQFEGEGLLRHGQPAGIEKVKIAPHPGVERLEQASLAEKIKVSASPLLRPTAWTAAASRVHSSRWQSRPELARLSLCQPALQIQSHPRPAGAHRTQGHAMPLQQAVADAASNPQASRVREPPLCSPAAGPAQRGARHGAPPAGRPETPQPLGAARCKLAGSTMPAAS